MKDKKFKIGANVLCNVALNNDTINVKGVITNCFKDITIGIHNYTLQITDSNTARLPKGHKLTVPAEWLSEA